MRIYQRSQQRAFKDGRKEEVLKELHVLYLKVLVIRMYFTDVLWTGVDMF
jgi:hypothetical protein